MLGGLRALDCSGELGWLAGRMLADLGVEVVKVEPPGAEVSGTDWQAGNVNKRLLRLELDSAEGRATFERLVERADFVIESAGPASRLAPRFDPARLRGLNPRLIHVQVTPFGASGPRADWRASDLELMAAGGAMSLAGEADGAPTRISAPQARAWAGAHAAIGALAALVHRQASGKGQDVDVSAQAAVIAAIAHAPTFVDVAGVVPTRCGAFITGRTLTGARCRAFWRCADGYLNFVLYGGAAGRRSNRMLVEWMREAGAELGALAGVDWARFDPKALDQAWVDRLEEPVARFFETITKREFLEGASRREMLGYPVSTMDDIAADPQLEARDFWRDVTLPDGTRQRHCGAFALVDGARAPLAHAPGEKVAADALLAEWSARRDAGRHAPADAAARATGPIEQALAGINVVEFASYAAGPHVGKLLANFGARVVHVESRRRPDGFRLEYPPFRNGTPGVDRGGCFAYFNDSKYGVTLDLKNDAGAALARRLVAWSDVVIENMRPGVMERLGLGYRALSALKPGLVMLSTCNMGQTGPRANTPGFGSQLSAQAGFCGLTGLRDGPPMLLYGPYIDFAASTMGAAAVLAAVVRKRETGEGAWIDIAQYETGLHFLAAPLLDYHASGRVAERSANRDPLAVPHDAYRCRGGEWVAVSCWSDDEFARLCATIGRPELASDARFCTRDARRSHLAALEPALAAWCEGREADAAARTLQAGRVHAHRVNTVRDLFRDAQLVHRRSWRRRRHPVIGDQAYSFPAFDLSQTPGDIIAPAPRLGEHNDVVFRELVGLSEEECEAHRARGAFD